jgi:hypothetical protein
MPPRFALRGLRAARSGLTPASHGRAAYGGKRRPDGRCLARRRGRGRVVFSQPISCVGVRSPCPQHLESKHLQRCQQGEQGKREHPGRVNERLPPFVGAGAPPISPKSHARKACACSGGNASGAIPAKGVYAGDRAHQGPPAASRFAGLQPLTRPPRTAFESGRLREMALPETPRKPAAAIRAQQSEPPTRPRARFRRLADRRWRRYPPKRAAVR